MTQRTVLSGLALCALALGPTESLAQGNLYEDWSESTISAERWRGGLPFLGHETGLDSERGIRGRQLVMSLRQQTDSSGEYRAGMSVLEMADAGAITTLQAVISVRQLNVQAGCPTLGGSPSEAGLLLVLGRFKDGPATDPGDRTNDVFAIVTADTNNELSGPRAIALNVQGFIGKCLDAACADFGTVGAGEDDDIALGTVAVGGQFRPRLTWDEAGDRFLFGLNNGADVAISYGDAGVSDATPAGKDIAAIAVRATSANCPTGTNLSYVKAFFSEIRTNAPASAPAQESARRPAP